MVVHTCNPSHSEVEIGGLWSNTGPGQSIRPYLKNKLKAKRTGGIQHKSACSKYEALNLIHQYCQKKKNR
jgi:hypothetical protein